MRIKWLILLSAPPREKSAFGSVGASVHRLSLRLRGRFGGGGVALWWVISRGDAFLLEQVRFGYGHSNKKGSLRFAFRLLLDPTRTDAEDGLFVEQSTGR